MRNIIYFASKLFAAKTNAKCIILSVAPNAKYTTKAEATLEFKPYKLFKLEGGLTNTATVTATEAAKLYEVMVHLRKIETQISNLYKQKLVTGFCHLYSGQEAVAAGMKAVMRPVDTLATSYRCHAWTYLMGGDAIGVISELTGRKTGCSKGKGGSMHLYGTNFFGGNGIVGSQVPIGAGLALAHMYRNDGGVAFALYGDGAANQGQVFEAFNLAKLWNLPVVFVCENNRYGMGTSAIRSSANLNFYARGDYIPGMWVDGMDVIATREATKYAIDYCLKGKGPLLVEMDTYRYFGHSMSDPGSSYRSREEVQEVRKTQDPITSFKKKILDAKLVTTEQLKEIDSNAKKMVDAAAKVAKTESPLSDDQLAADVYYLNLHSDIRGTRPDAPFKHLDVAPRKMVTEPVSKSSK